MKKLLLLLSTICAIQLSLIAQIVLKPMKLPETINQKGYDLVSFVLSPDCSKLIYVQTKDYKDYLMFMSERRDAEWGEPRQIHTFDDAGRKAEHKSLQNLIALLRFDGVNLEFFKALEASRDFSDLKYVRYTSVFDGKEFKIPTVISEEKGEAIWRYEGNSQYKSFTVFGADPKKQQVIENYTDKDGDWSQKELPVEAIGHGIQAILPVGENGMAYKHLREDGKKWETEIFLSLKDQENWSIPLQLVIEGSENDESIYFTAYDEVYGEFYLDIKDEIYTAALPYHIMQQISTTYPKRKFVTEVKEGKPAEIKPKQAKPKYYALMMAIDDYQYNNQDLVDLQKPIADARSLRNVLTTEYNFEEQDIFLLENPNRNEIINSFEEIAKVITEKDNLLIFYAGHGILDETLNLGYWLSADATTESKVNWISNSTVRDYIAGLKTQHTLLISDACFSGSIFKSRAVTSSIDDFGYYRLNKMPSRKAMTSGSLNSVPDDSKFMKYLVKALANNEKEYLQSKHLFHEIEVAIINNTSNIPQFGSIQNSGDEGGDFIFVKRTKN